MRSALVSAAVNAVGGGEVAAAGCTCPSWSDTTPEITMSAGICRRARCAKVTAAKSPSPGDHRAHGVGLSEQRVSPELPRIGWHRRSAQAMPLQLIDPRLNASGNVTASKSPPMTQVQADQSSIPGCSRTIRGNDSRAGQIVAISPISRSTLRMIR
ncbi:MAG: hypothetical protein U0232_24510 [Thermomicrobiales bacterium]